MNRPADQGNGSTTTALPRPRSAAVFDGPDRAAARAYMKGIGFDDDALSRPTIGIANTWTEAMPCNFHLRGLAEHVKEGVRAAGGTPMEFNTVAISDGITMGTSGMKTSLVSREVIADSIELTARGYQFDAIVALSACDKTIPGCVMALARLDIPSVMLYGGSIAPGRWQRPRRHDPRRVRGDRRPRGGQDVRGGAPLPRGRRQPRAPEPAAASSPRTRWPARSRRWESRRAGRRWFRPRMSDKATVAEQIGELVMRVLADDLRPSQMITHESLENAIACVCASGGSTNACPSPAGGRPRGRDRARASTTSSGSRRQTPLWRT